MPEDLKNTFFKNCVRNYEKYYVKNCVKDFAKFLQQHILQNILHFRPREEAVNTVT